MNNNELKFITDIVHDISTRSYYNNCVISSKSSNKRSAFVDTIIDLFSNSDKFCSDIISAGIAEEYQIAQLKYDLAHANIHVLKAVFEEQNPLSLTDAILKCLGMDPILPDIYSLIEFGVDSILSKSKYERIVFITDDIQKFCKSGMDFCQLQTITARLEGKVYFICINQYVEDYYEHQVFPVFYLKKILDHGHDFRHIYCRENVWAQKTVLNLSRRRIYYLFIYYSYTYKNVSLFANIPYLCTTLINKIIKRWKN